MTFRIARLVVGYLTISTTPFAFAQPQLQISDNEVVLANSTEQPLDFRFGPFLRHLAPRETKIFVCIPGAHDIYMQTADKPIVDKRLDCGGRYALYFNESQGLYDVAPTQSQGQSYNAYREFQERQRTGGLNR
jgi:hypothetical protein